MPQALLVVARFGWKSNLCQPVQRLRRLSAGYLPEHHPFLVYRTELIPLFKLRQVNYKPVLEKSRILFLLPLRRVVHSLGQSSSLSHSRVRQLFQ